MQELPYTNVITFDDSKSELIMNTTAEAQGDPLVNLLNTRPILATRTGEPAWCTSWSTAREATARESFSTSTGTRLRIQLLHDRVRNRLKFLLLLVVLLHRSLLRSIQPGDCIIHRALQLRLVCGIEFSSKLLIAQRVAEVVCIRLETVLRSNASGRSLILSYDEVSK